MAGRAREVARRARAVDARTARASLVIDSRPVCARLHARGQGSWNCPTNRPLPGRCSSSQRSRRASRRPEGDAPGWRAEILTLSDPGRIRNSSGGFSATASPSIPACTGAGAFASNRGELHARPGRRPPLRRGVEDDNAEPPAAEARASALHEPAIQGVGVVRNDHDGRMRVLVSQVVYDAQLRHGPARTEHRLRRFQQRSHLGGAVRGFSEPRRRRSRARRC